MEEIMRTKITSKNISLAFVGFLVGAGCSQGSNESSLQSESLSTAVGFSKFNVNRNPMNKTVCDPFTGGESQDPQKGIKASLFYRGKNMPIFSTAQKYVDNGYKSSQVLFFTDMYVPTRMFSEGFSNQTSAVVKDDDGNKLIEYFGLKFETVLRLKADDQEGDYELGSLADDGSVVRAKIDGVWKVIINNDGDHPTKMGCSSQLIHMTKESAIPIEVTYYQGPRYHIAHTLMWRHVSCAGGEVGKDKECGKSGNTYFFDPNNGSKALSPFLGLLNRGWRPIDKDNFYLSENPTEYNPCQDAVAPTITGFKVDEVLSQDIFVSWSTDVPATSQVLVTNVLTGEQQLTESNLALHLDHAVRVIGLLPNTEYTVQAVSIGENLGRVMSDPITVRTSP